MGQLGMVDAISVCNQAIYECGGGEFGSPRLQSFADGTTLATMCAEFFPGARDSTLEMHPFNFSTTFARLVHAPEDRTAPYAYKWRYAYLLPAEPYCLKVRGTDEGPGARFEIAKDQHGHRVLLSSQPQVSIEYTARITDIGSWSPLAVQVLVKVLASKLAKPLTGQSSLTEQKMKEALLLLPEARGADGREGSPFRLRANTSLTRARHASGRGWSQGSIVVDG